MLDQFSATVEKIYSAASGELSFRDALLEIENLTGSTGAVIDLVPISPTIRPATLSGSFSEENCLEYSRDYQAICPRIRHAISHPDIPIHYDYAFINEGEMNRDPVYDWFGKHGLRYYLGSPVAKTDNYLAFVSLQRTRRQGHVEARDIKLFDALRPHLCRAINLAEQLGTLKSFDRFSASVLEALPQGVFALDRKGMVRFTNDRAARILSANDGIALESGHLKTASTSDQLRLDRLVADAASPAPVPSTSSGWIRVARRSGRLPYAVFIAPLATSDEEFLGGGCRVLVLVHDLSECRAADCDMLVSMFDLTQTEARLAAALSSGHSMESAASLLRIQLTTARSHLKSIFRKTGVGRQQDLIRLLTSMSSMSPPSPFG